MVKYLQVKHAKSKSTTTTVARSYQVYHRATIKRQRWRCASSTDQTQRSSTGTPSLRRELLGVNRSSPLIMRRQTSAAGCNLCLRGEPSDRYENQHSWYTTVKHTGTELPPWGMNKPHVHQEIILKGLDLLYFMPYEAWCMRHEATRGNLTPKARLHGSSGEFELDVRGNQRGLRAQNADCGQGRLPHDVKPKTPHSKNTKQPQPLTSKYSSKTRRRPKRHHVLRRL